MPTPHIVSPSEWLTARKAHLLEEKAFTRARDALSAKRRELPWTRVDCNYVFSGPDGETSLFELFGDKSQLIIYHFMYGPDWQDGCPSCSFWADSFNGIAPHLAARDAAFAVISRAPHDILAAYRKRMGWDFNWLSSHDNSFNQDYYVSFLDEELENGSAIYNYQKSTFPGKEAPGISVFTKDNDGYIFHTYSAYARGLDMLNSAYHFMDLLPGGRDENGLDYPQAWVKRHDEY